MLQKLSLYLTYLKQFPEDAPEYISSASIAEDLMQEKVLWITETAIFLALLVAVQGLTAGFGNQFLTGSCVNLILAVAALLAGPWSGAVVAAVSPFLASAFGIGPKFIQLLPVVALGNLVFVLVLYALVSGGVIPEKAAVVLTVQFSWPQPVTALIGGALAMLIVPALKRALHRA